MDDTKLAMSKETEAPARSESMSSQTQTHVENLLTNTNTAAADEVDDAILRANGHEAVLQRQFRWISALGLAFSITNSWIGYLSNFGQNLIYGGPAVVIFGLIIAFFAQGIISIGLGELASAFPSSGGQYHFCYILAPEKHKRFTAFVVGWMSILAWWIVTASGTSLAAVTVIGLAKFFHPEYTSHSWQVWLIYCAVAFVTSKSSCLLRNIVTDSQRSHSIVRLAAQDLDHSPSIIVRLAHRLCPLLHHHSLHVRSQTTRRLGRQRRTRHQWLG